ncbi:hypothetical protein [Clostridium luticellarii]|jgi:hypothetical protein|uniref:hypothetical protein n=1 Tax=Clostridium luticellarii TaxID=1691940 RepID=UPI002354439B|nr:hypothetical protein [Clostridium luticellarii]MCI1946416.1 YuzF family protein [Clostridium luticellarii]MCI1969674.1 YuzF family protein [Clostridium luticellarii]MCI1996897.1 YuzF family protein [Clostridium luticellarii]MCI2041168.1 YuzF family protein [Clostridium luticellarii]
MSRHHRRHSRNHRSDIIDENYYVPDERSNSNSIGIEEKDSEEDNLWQNPVYSKINLEDKNQGEDDGNIPNREDPPENLSESTPFAKVSNSSNHSRKKHHLDKYNGIGAISFTEMLKKYIGQMVTIHTVGGNTSRCNFSGILLGVNNHFIRLILRVGSAPFYPAKNDFINDLNTYSDPYSSADNCNSESKPCPENNNMSAFVDIPINKITAFFHGNN